MPGKVGAGTREEVRVVHGVARFPIPLLQDATCSVVPGPAHVRYGLFDVVGGGHEDPAQATVTPAGLIRQPAVVAAGDRKLPLRRNRGCLEEQGRIDDVRFDTKLVHVAYARRHVEQLALGYRRSSNDVVAIRPTPLEPLDFPVMLPARPRGKGAPHGPVLLLVDVFPGIVGFVDMGIRVDDPGYRHFGPSRRPFSRALAARGRRTAWGSRTSFSWGPHRG